MIPWRNSCFLAISWRYFHFFLKHAKSSAKQNKRNRKPHRLWRNSDFFHRICKTDKICVIRIFFKEISFFHDPLTKIALFSHGLFNEICIYLWSFNKNYVFLIFSSSKYTHFPRPFEKIRKFFPIFLHNLHIFAILRKIRAFFLKIRLFSAIFLKKLPIFCNISRKFAYFRDLWKESLEFSTEFLYFPQFLKKIRFLSTKFVYFSSIFQNSRIFYDPLTKFTYFLQSFCKTRLFSLIFLQNTFSFSWILLKFLYFLRFFEKIHIFF